MLSTWALRNFRLALWHCAIALTLTSCSAELQNSVVRNYFMLASANNSRNEVTEVYIYEIDHTNGNLRAPKVFNAGDTITALASNPFRNEFYVFKKNSTKFYVSVYRYDPETTLAKEIYSIETGFEVENATVNESGTLLYVSNKPPTAPNPRQTASDGIQIFDIRQDGKVQLSSAIAIANYSTDSVTRVGTMSVFPQINRIVSTLGSLSPYFVDHLIENEGRSLKFLYESGKFPYASTGTTFGAAPIPNTSFLAMTFTLVTPAGQQLIKLLKLEPTEGKAPWVFATNTLSYCAAAKDLRIYSKARAIYMRSGSGDELCTANYSIGGSDSAEVSGVVQHFSKLYIGNATTTTNIQGMNALAVAGDLPYLYASTESNLHVFKISTSRNGYLTYLNGFGGISSTQDLVPFLVYKKAPKS